MLTNGTLGLNRGIWTTALTSKRNRNKENKCVSGQKKKREGFISSDAAIPLRLAQVIVCLWFVKRKSHLFLYTSIFRLLISLHIQITNTIIRLIHCHLVATLSGIIIRRSSKRTYRRITSYPLAMRSSHNEASIKRLSVDLCCNCKWLCSDTMVEVRAGQTPSCVNGQGSGENKWRVRRGYKRHCVRVELCHKILQV